MTPQLFTLVSSIRSLFAKHHPVIFITIITLLLAAAVFSLYQILDITSQPATATSTVTTFDKVTVDKIKKLHDSSDSTETLVFPKPRTNPFTE
ncbi:MAG: hypothetical protein JWN75_339 [Candidatus Saccharibacteria bacterium]|nr:hypothetical protein [Candidatus Saccharibacteria bacterium]